MFNRLHTLLQEKVLSSELFRTTLTFFQSSVLKLLIQTVYFAVLARDFGPEKYGSYVGVIAVVSFFMPFTNWGSDRILIRNVSRDQSAFSICCGTAILKNLIFGSAFVAVVLMILVLLPIPSITLHIAFYLAISNLILMRLSDIFRDAFIAAGRPKQASIIIILLSASRLVALLAFVAFFDDRSLLAWSMLYCLATLFSAVFSAVLAIRSLGYPRFKLSTIMQDIPQGFSFAVGWSSEVISSDLDKSMLAMLSTVQSAGIYGAAYHILSVAFVPIQSLMVALFRNFFKVGAAGIQASLGLCKRILPISLTYALFAMGGILLFAPWVPKLLGENYTDSVYALMWLSPTILFRTAHLFAADILSGADYQRVRSSVQVLVACLNGILNLWLIPLYQWYGAVWATIASDFLLMVLLWGGVLIYLKRSHENLA
jgi:O-antigen/teichoic acid export membrane protein